MVEVTGYDDDKYNSIHFGLIKWGYTLLFLVLPFSLPVLWNEHQIEIPSEPLLAGLSILLLIWHYRYGFWSADFYRTPLTLSSLGFILWMAACVIWSDSPVVSIKYTLVAVTHWWVFYHGLPLVIHKNDNYLPFFLKYSLSFILIMLFAWAVHASYGFRMDASVLVARPFYFDHAMYGAVFLLLIAHFFRFRKNAKTEKDNITKWEWVLGALMLIGVYLSFSRAAWLSAVAALGLVLAIRLIKLKFWHLGLLTILAAGVLILTAPHLKEQLSKNRVESKHGSIWEQIVSTANVSTDVSNLERLNRYSCALRMTQDKPWTGFGPGTFQVAYIPYQRAGEMTRISVTEDQPNHRPGKGGGAHSEYLQAFSEMGILGGILWLSLLITTLWTAMSLYHQNGQPALQQTAIILLFGLMTFFVHGLFNNFLHQGKVAVLVWSSMAVLNHLYLSTILKQKWFGPVLTIASVRKPRRHSE